MIHCRGHCRSGIFDCEIFLQSCHHIHQYTNRIHPLDDTASFCTDHSRHKVECGHLRPPVATGPPQGVVNNFLVTFDKGLE